MRQPDILTRIGLWSDDFDTDLFNVFPDLRDSPEVKKAQERDVFTLASVAEKDGRLIMAHPTVWNHELGMIAFFWTKRPYLEENKDGWKSIGCYSTSEPLVCISLWDAIRDAWCHNYNAMLDGHHWFQDPGFNEVFYPIMADIRDWWHDPKVPPCRKQARRWALSATKI